MRGGNYVLGWLASLALAITAGPAVGQPQSQPQLQYTYDAAGNLIQITRSQVTPKPDLTIRNLAVGAIIVNADGSFAIPATFQINNIGGDQAIAPWYDRGYLSVNATLHDTDQALAGYNTHSTNLAAGAGYSVAATFKTTTTTPAGNYYLVIRADGGAGSGQYSPTGTNYVAESDETNNAQSVAIVLPANAKPDLTLTNAKVGAVTVNQNGSYAIPVTFTVTNAGIAAAAGSWYDTAYLSTDGVLDNGDVNFGYVLRGGGLAAGQSYDVSTTFTTSTTTNAGTYTLFLKADGHGATVGGANTDNGAVSESNETNNTQALSLALSKPDLAISNLAVGTITSKQGGGYYIPISYTVSNLGTATAKATWYDMAYLSADGVLDNADQTLSPYTARSADLAGGARYTVSTTLATSSATAAGTYTLFVKTDGRSPTYFGGTTITDSGYVTETNEANNVTSTSVSLH